ncbi:hypothetical protein DPMN_056578 [Dreissena polymorpha]|uniref:Uncharacterized protein n=1 Tax=Dreissena polymorpha TaxID=45954 RepID=A0A9D4HV68_DREPO|nr:hypothetical protein DPMN_056578 [Dreissena polymorpha]
MPNAARVAPAQQAHPGSLVRCFPVCLLHLKILGDFIVDSAAPNQTAHAGLELFWHIWTMLCEKGV